MAEPAFLGRGIIRPFRRDAKNDFANASGRALVAACAGQILGTRARGPKASGELRWRGAFGSRLYQLRHKPINTTTRELARHYAREDLARWEPRLVVVTVDLIGDQQRRLIQVSLGIDVIDRNVPGNRVVLSGVPVTVSL